MKPRTLALALVPVLLPALAPAPASAQFFGGRPQAKEPDTVALSAMDARSIGPATMSGRIGDVVGVPGTRDTLFVGAATGGVWESTDGGTTFEPIFDDEPTLSIGEIAVHPSHHDVIWVGTGEDNPRNSVGMGRGMFRSIDGGKTWTHVGLEKSEHIARILLDPDDADVAWVAATGPLWNDGGQRGIYRTTDGGRHWSLVLAPPNPTTGGADLAMDPHNPDKIIATLWQRRRWPYFFKSGGPGSGLYLSYDGGDSWKRVTSEDGLPEGPLGKINVAIAPSNPQIVYALVEAKRTQLLRSEDGGRTWDTVNRSEGMGDRPFYYNRLEVDPSNPDRVYHIAGDLRVSDDGGHSFHSITRGKGVHVDHHAMWIDPNDPSYLVDSNDGGVYISQDRGKSWRFVSNLPLAQFYEIAVDDQVPYHVYGGLQDNGNWRGPSTSWRGGGIRNYRWVSIGFGDGFATMEDPNDPRYGWSEWQGGNLMRYDRETGYLRWTKPAPPDDSTKLRFNWNAPVAVSPQDSNTLYLGAQFVYRSTDDGMSWERISPDLTTDNLAWQQQDRSGGLTPDVTGAEMYTTVYALAPSPLDADVIWAGTDDGNVQVTRDGGGTWTNVQGNMPDKPRNAWVSHIEASHHDAGTAYAAIHDYMRGDWTTYVYRTTDYGRHWQRLPTGPVDGWARTLEEDPVNPNLLWLGTEFGLYYSLDRGRSWTQWRHGFPNGVPVDALVTQERESDLVVGTFGRAAYVIDDVRPLRALAGDPSLLHADLHLFEPGTAVEHQQTGHITYDSPGSTMYEGENEPYGATVTIAAHVPDSLATKEAGAKGGEASRSGGGAGGGEDVAAAADTAEYPYTEVESAPDTTPPVPTKAAVFQVLDGDSVIREDSLQLEEGLNRHTWAFSTDGPGRRPRSMDELETALSSPDTTAAPKGRGPAVLPGTYTVRVISLGDTVSGPLRVEGDPRIDTPMSERRAKREMLVEVARLQGAAADAVEALRTARIRLNRALEALAAQESLFGAAADSLREAGKTAVDSLKAVEEAWTGPIEERQGITGGETVMGKIGIAPFRMSDVAWYGPNPEERKRLELGRDAVSKAIDRTNRVLEGQVAPFRERVSRAGVELIPPVEAVAMPGGGNSNGGAGR
ncbi:MAG TPA: hypothetical protein VKB18_05300 [Gemmatimonadota bacterium]|nr:hypothetical protein [Gemmatimonadota bacterium]